MNFIRVLEIRSFFRIIWYKLLIKNYEECITSLNSYIYYQHFNIYYKIMDRLPIDEFTFEYAKKLMDGKKIWLPSSANSNRLISNEKRFAGWKEEMMRKYPEAIIQFSPDKINPFELISDKFLAQKNHLSRNIGKYGSLD